MGKFILMEELVLKAIEETKKLMTNKNTNKKISAKDNILQYDDVFVQMLIHIVKPINDSGIFDLWFKNADGIMQACNDQECNPFEGNGREGIEVYLETVVFEHFDVYGFETKSKRGGTRL